VPSSTTLNDGSAAKTPGSAPRQHLARVVTDIAVS
jgi:hypothetical protein